MAIHQMDERTRPAPVTFLIDSTSDAASLPTDVPVGSLAVCADSGAIYCLDTTKTWKGW